MRLAVAPLTLGVEKRRKNILADHTSERRLRVFYAPKAAGAVGARLSALAEAKSELHGDPRRGQRHSACTWPAARASVIFLRRRVRNIRAESHQPLPPQLLLMMQKSQHTRRATEIISAQVAPLRLYL